jgi:hypothetical protein
MQLKVKKNFSWAHRGVEINDYVTGQLIDTEDQSLIDVSTKEGWTEFLKVKKSPVFSEAPIVETPGSNDKALVSSHDDLLQE